MKDIELMIGDWVSLFQGNPDGSSCNVQVTYIGEYGEVGIEGCEEYTSANCNLLFPIPITVEILEKNGFTGGEYVSYTGDVWYLKQEEFVELGLTVSHNTAILWGKKKLGYPYSSGNNFLISNIHSVHELQHALKICGSEKEIKL